MASTAAHILITSGPTREYLDPVRYLTNASSGRMGAALARAALALGHKVSIVSGPVDIPYPSEAALVPVVTTAEMAAACAELFPRCDGLIAAAAPCDYRPLAVAEHKLEKSGHGLTLALTETVDIVARLAAVRDRQWLVAFALETRDAHLRAMKKLQRKNCDLICVNGPSAIDSADAQVSVLDRNGKVVGEFTGDKSAVARGILEVIQRELLHGSAARSV